MAPRNKSFQIRHNHRMGTAVQIALDEFLARSERADFQREEIIEGELIVSPGT
jgi:hypothetical protein